MSNPTKKVLGMAGSQMFRSPLSSLVNANSQSTSGNPRYDINHMRSFMSSLKTPAEIRRNDAKEAEMRREPSKEVPVVENSGEREKNRGEEGENGVKAPLNRRLEFENVGFMSFGESVVADTNDNSTNKEMPDNSENIENENLNMTNNTNKRSKTTKRNEPPSKTRKAAVEKKKNIHITKSAAAAKKGFKDNVLTIKFKLSDIQVKAGQIPDFALFVKDDVHKSTSKNAASHANKYITYIKGDISNKFFGKGISYNPDEYFICKNEIDLTEEKVISLDKRKISKAVKKSVGKTVILRGDISSGNESFSEENESQVIEGCTESESESENIDIYQVGKTAKKMRWGPPSRQSSESSESSGGVNVYGRGADKSTTRKKKSRNSRKNAKVLEDNIDNTCFNMFADRKARKVVSTGGKKKVQSRTKSKKRVNRF